MVAYLVSRQTPEIGLRMALGATRGNVLAFVTEPSLVLLIAPVMVIAVALLAIYIPARRAAKLDPMVALRYE